MAPQPSFRSGTRLKLTQPAVASALASHKPGLKVRLWDKTEPSLCLRITPNGLGSYVFSTWVDSPRSPSGRTRTEAVLGRANEASRERNIKGEIITVAMARERAKAEAHRIAHERQNNGGRLEKLADVRRDARARVLAERRAQGKPLKDVAKSYITLHIKAKLKPATQAAFEWLFERYVIPALGNMPINTITLEVIAAFIDKVATKQFTLPATDTLKEKRLSGGPKVAKDCYLQLSALFNWHQSRDHTFTSPIRPGMGKNFGSVSNERERVLTNDEIKAVWNACEGLGTFGSIVRLMFWTCARPGEVVQLRRTQFTEGVWTLPDTKNGDALELPLSKQAIALIDQLKEATNHDLLLNVDGNPFTAWPKMKVALDKRSGVLGWELRDIRRTMRTMASKLGVKHEVGEALLNHRLKGVARVYNRHDRIEEKGEALQLMADHLERITKQ